jgi:hypothetical protein
MIGRLRDIAVEFAISVQVGRVVRRHLRQVNRAENSRRPRVEADAVNPVTSNRSDIETPGPSCTRASHTPAVARIEIQIAEVTGPADQRAHELPWKSYFARSVVNE